MGDLSNDINLLLANEDGIIPTSIKQLCMALDRYHDAKEKLEVQRHQDILESNAQIMTAIGLSKTATNAECVKCRTEVDKKLDLFKTWVSLAENPKLLRFVVVLCILVVILAWKGGAMVFADIVKLASLIK